MTAHESPRLRADATRNRRAILDAADELLTQDGVENLTMDRVAAAAGVGKGTIFHRFGSRAGLIRELIFERAQDLLEHVQSGPAPIGPGAPAAERLLAFFDGFTGLIGDNIELVMAYAGVGRDSDDDRAAMMHEFWQRHIAALLTELRPDLDVELTAMLLHTSLGGTFVWEMIRRGETERYRAGVRALVASIIATPVGSGQMT